VSDDKEYKAWHSAWAETIAANPGRKGHCGGTFSRHSLYCGYAPPYGYDRNGVPYTESQIPKILAAVAQKYNADFNERLLKWMEK
jgi:hypothetical protein